MGDSFMGLHARLDVAGSAQDSPESVARANACMIFINQVREKIGVVFGNPETTTGGRALKFYSSVRVEVRRMSALKDGDTVIGNRTKVKIVKNKVASPIPRSGGGHPLRRRYFARKRPARSRRRRRE